MKSNTSFSILLSEKQYLKNLIATTITRFGDGIDSIAFAWLVYEITGSSALLAITFGISGLPTLFLGMISGVITSYIPKKTTLFLCDLARGTFVTITALLYFSGTIKVWHILLIAFLNSTAEAFRHPPSIAIMPLILKEENIDLGLSFNSSLTSASQVIGICIAPLLISTIGLSGAIIIDAITFFLCAIITMTLKYKDETINTGKLTLKSGTSDFKDGLKILFTNKFFLNLCIFATIINALFVPINSFAPAYSANLGLGPEGVSLMQTPLLIAMAVGALFVPILKNKLGGKNIFIIGGCLLGVSYCFFAVMGVFSTPLLYLLLALSGFIMGFALITINIPVQIAMTTKIDKDYLMRLTSIFGAVAQGAMPISAFILGGIISFISIESLFFIFGILTTILFITQKFNKNLDQLD